MKKLEKLIKQYKKELQDIFEMFDVTRIKDIGNVRYRSFAEAIRNHLSELENLAKELAKDESSKQKEKTCSKCASEFDRGFTAGYNSAFATPE